jgi:hypothetical protein
VGPRSGLDAVVRRKFPSLCREKSCVSKLIMSCSSVVGSVINQQRLQLYEFKYSGNLVSPYGMIDEENERQTFKSIME